MKNKNIVGLFVAIMIAFNLFSMFKAGSVNPITLVVCGVIFLVIVIGMINQSKLKVKNKPKINEQDVLEYEEIINNIPKLVEHRKKYRFSSAIMTVFMIFIFFSFTPLNLFFAPIFAPILNKLGMSAIVIPIIVFIIISITSSVAQKEYTEIYKNEIIKSLVTKRGLEYSVNGMREDDYRGGKYEFYDIYSSDDLIKGQIDDCTFQLADVHTEKEYEDEDGHKHYQTIFHGTVAIAHLKRDSKVMIDITPDTVGFGKKSNYVEIDNHEFEKVFDVYGSDEIQTMKLLTPDVTMSILDLREALGAAFTIKIMNNVVYFRFYNGGLFEPCINNPKKEAEALCVYFHMLDGIQNVIATMSKEMESFIDG